jgi:hypothetical protein
MESKFQLVQPTHSENATMPYFGRFHGSATLFDPDYASNRNRPHQAGRILILQANREYCPKNRPTRAAETNGYSTGDADRIKPSPSPRVTAVSACGQNQRTQTLFGVPKIVVTNGCYYHTS